MACAEFCVLVLGPIEFLFILRLRVQGLLFWVEKGGLGFRVRGLLFWGSGLKRLWQ